MPRDVDLRQRLADIAGATVAVARASGAHAVTIRSVAAELGGSTTLVTNYLPSRAALILNALDHGRERWDRELDTVLAAVPAAARLSATVDWAMSSTYDDPVLRTLILEVVASSPVEPELRESLQRESVAFQDLLFDMASESGYTDPRGVADKVFLLLRGAHLAVIESPERFSAEHSRHLITAVLAGEPRAAAQRRT